MPPSLDVARGMRYRYRSACLKDFRQNELESMERVKGFIAQAAWYRSAIEQIYGHGGQNGEVCDGGKKEKN